MLSRPCAASHLTEDNKGRESMPPDALPDSFGFSLDMSGRPGTLILKGAPTSRANFNNL